MSNAPILQTLACLKLSLCMRAVLLKLPRNPTSGVSLPASMDSISNLPTIVEQEINGKAEVQLENFAL